MQGILNVDEKKVMFTEMKEQSQVFVKDLKKGVEELISVAQEASYEGTDTIANSAIAGTETIAENLDTFNKLFRDLADTYAKSGVLSDSELEFFKKYADDEENFKLEYETIKSPEGTQNYDVKTHSQRIQETIAKYDTIRTNFLDTVAAAYKGKAGEDIADLIKPLFIKLEAACNDFINNLKKTVDGLVATDERLLAIQKALEEISSGMKVSDTQEATQRKFGSIDASKYLGGDL